MIRLDDLNFERADCCATHQSATVLREDGVEVGLVRGDEDTYSVTLYRNGGLWRRECCVTAERAQALLGAAA